MEAQCVISNFKTSLERCDEKEFRAYVTVYCLENNIEQYTNEWINTLSEFYHNYYCGDRDFSDFALFMAG